MRVEMSGGPSETGFVLSLAKRSKINMKIAVALLLTMFLLNNYKAIAAPSAQVGKAAPAFSLRDQQGVLIALKDLAYPGTERPSFPKQVVLLDFFRTDCKPCMTSIPKLIEIQKKYRDKPLKILLVALLEEQNGESKLEGFLSKQKLPFKVIIDTYGAVSKKYIEKGGVFQLPTLFVIDRSGIIRSRFGVVTGESVNKLSKSIEELLQ